MRLLVLSVLLAVSSSPMLAQNTALSLSDSTGSQQAANRETQRVLFAPFAQNHSFKVEDRSFAADSTDENVWRRFRIGAAVGFGIGAVAGILFQERINRQATEGPDISPLFDGIAFGLVGAVLGGAVAARWPH